MTLPSYHLHINERPLLWIVISKVGMAWCASERGEGESETEVRSQICVKDREPEMRVMIMMRKDDEPTIGEKETAFLWVLTQHYANQNSKCKKISCISERNSVRQHSSVRHFSSSCLVREDERGEHIFVRNYWEEDDRTQGDVGRNFVLIL